MAKIPRFIKEYANYTKKSILNSELMNDEIKQKAIKNIDRALRLTKNNFITIDESMRLILKCFK